VAHRKASTEEFDTTVDKLSKRFAGEFAGSQQSDIYQLFETLVVIR
jgi:hypothetical protein